MGIIKDITGQKFNNLIAIKFIEMCQSGQAKWLFKCDCGREKILRKNNVICGYTKSCGCSNLHFTGKFGTWNKKHGMSHTNFYRVWDNMVGRCKNKNIPCYKNYGGRGIKVCDKWLNFINFKKDMYESYLEHKFNITIEIKQNTTLDRIDNNGNYEPKNCRWATRKEQRINQRI